MGDPVKPISNPTLANLISKFSCGGLDELQSINLIGRLLSTLYDEEAGKIVLAGGSSFIIPKYDKIVFEYVASGAADDDLISAQEFYKNDELVATLTYTYIGSTNNIDNIALTLP